MLTYEQIKEYFTAELAKSNPKAILVEYLQYEFLDSLFKQTGSENLSFIGGTAVRFIYNGQRFSEDLDFDNFGLNFTQFRSLVKKACREIQIKGFKIEYRFVTKGKNFHCYLKFPAVLDQYNISAHHQEKILVSIDAEIKKKIFEPEIKTLNKFGVYRKINANPAGILLSQKLITILSRKREKGRDFYDASFLAGLARADFDYIKNTTALEAAEFKEKLIQHCSKLDYKALAKDVAPFLFNVGEKERILNFQNTLSEIFKSS